MAGYRRAIAPRANDRARVWARLEDEPIPTPIVRSRRRTATIALGCAIAAALLLLTLRPTAQAPAATREREETQTVYDANAEPSTTATSVSPVERPPTRRDAPQVVAPIVEAEPPVASPRRPPPARRAPAPAEDPLRGELQIIEAARAALDRDDHDRALALLREHGLRFPDGALALEARSLRAITLCEAGRTMQGRGEARTMLQERSSSPYRARLREACDLR